MQSHHHPLKGLFKIKDIPMLQKRFLRRHREHNSSENSQKMTAPAGSKLKQTFGSLETLAARPICRVVAAVNSSRAPAAMRCQPGGSGGCTTPVALALNQMPWLPRLSCCSASEFSPISTIFLSPVMLELDYALVIAYRLCTALHCIAHAKEQWIYDNAYHASQCGGLAFSTPNACKPYFHAKASCHRGWALSLVEPSEGHTKVLLQAL